MIANMKCYAHYEGGMFQWTGRNRQNYPSNSLVTRVGGAKALTFRIKGKYWGCIGVGSFMVYINSQDGWTGWSHGPRDGT